MPMNIIRSMPPHHTIALAMKNQAFPLFVMVMDGNFIIKMNYEIFLF